MTKGEFLAMLARRLGEPRRVIDRRVEALHSSGIVGRVAGSRRWPPPLAEPEAVPILLATVGADTAVDAPAAAQRLAALTDADGLTLEQVLREALFGPPVHVGDLIVRRDSASIEIGGKHRQFGERGNSPARFIAGRTLMAMAAELHGSSPGEADTLAALMAIR